MPAIDVNYCTQPNLTFFSFTWWPGAFPESLIGHYHRVTLPEHKGKTCSSCFGKWRHPDCEVIAEISTFAVGKQIQKSRPDSEKELIRRVTDDDAEDVYFHIGDKH
jgi:hypothetical protein